MVISKQLFSVSRALLIAIVFACSSCFFGPNPNALYFDSSSLDQIREQEKKLGAKEYNGFSHGIGRVSDKQTWGQSIMFLRSDTDFLPLLTKYYFDADSTVQFIQYEWNKAVPGTSVKERDNMMLEEREKHTAYHHKFMEIAKQITNSYGSPTQGDGRVKRIPFEQLYMYKADYSWDLEDRSIHHRMVWIPSQGIPVFKIFTKVAFKE